MSSKRKKVNLKAFWTFGVLSWWAVIITDDGKVFTLKFLANSFIFLLSKVRFFYVSGSARQVFSVNRAESAVEPSHGDFDRAESPVEPSQAISIEPSHRSSRARQKQPSQAESPSRAESGTKKNCEENFSLVHSMDSTFSFMIQIRLWIFFLKMFIAEDKFQMRENAFNSYFGHWYWDNIKSCNAQCWLLQLLRGIGLFYPSHTVLISFWLRAFHAFHLQEFGEELFGTIVSYDGIFSIFAAVVELNNCRMR